MNVKNKRSVLSIVSCHLRPFHSGFLDTQDFQSILRPWEFTLTFSCNSQIYVDDTSRIYNILNVLHGECPESLTMLFLFVSFPRTVITL